MKINKLNSIIALGLVAIIGILVAQLLWTKEAFNIEERKFSQTTHIALLEVVKKLYEGTNHELPSENPIVKVANDYYIVNVANDFEPEILEYYLKTEFKKRNITTDFEYAMYNCSSDEMVYGNYVSLTDNEKGKKTVHFPKHKNLVYYFAIRFPNERTYLFSSLKFWFVLSLALIVILLVYAYSIFTILQQKKFSELQRDFINNMTHEFKTPLSSILLASNYLMKQPAISSDEKLHKYTGIIINQSNKLNGHIGKILNVAKSDGAPLELNRENIDPVEVVRNVADNMKLKHETLSVEVIADRDYSITADEFHFTNIIYNLIDNAIKYCEHKPEINVRFSESNHQLKIAFKDNGVGVSDNNLPLIFDKFVRVPNSKSNEINGFGLGLYYVKKICTQHGWKISANNNSDHGLTMTLTIPLK
ncbi:MAG: HAMP domain-containing histidine kinase [Flavobacterium sp.]|nr:MAG: HAMP domain-containing histidine kinase [Flavobacterium sp.]